MTVMSRTKFVHFAMSLFIPIAAFGCSRMAGPRLKTGVSAAQVEAATMKVWPALVRIHVVDAYYSEGRERKSQASGSGFVISSDGYVVTNHHVAGDAVRLMCTMSNREEIPA